MKILITGAKGQLGYDCVKVLSNQYKVIPFDLDDFDITNLEEVQKQIDDTKPDIIVNCAAYTKVDACETDKENAWLVNAKGPQNLALAAKKNRAKLIHISTDYVFSGNKKIPNPYYENDECNPISYYGKSKLDGEKAIREITDQHIILRIAWLYGIHGHNILKTMLKLVMSDPEKKLKVVNDQFGSPTWSYSVALQIEKIISSNVSGTVHATSEGYCSWYDLITYFLDKMELTYNISPCTTKEYPTPAKRPANSILENSYLKQNNLNIMPFWKQDIDQYVSMFKKFLIKECATQNLN